MVSLEVYGETLTLLPERAVYWERTRTLFIADMHLGKTATFQAHGIPLPEGNTAADLNRLSLALEKTGAAKLIILGDFLHAAKGRDSNTLNAFSEWRDDRADLKIWLVRGNHDRGAGDPPETWQINVVNGPTPGPNFVLNHEPLIPTQGYLLAGHLHPGVQLSGKARQMLRLPCFWFGTQYAVLPAFGSFTGISIVRPDENDRIFVIAEQQVITVR